MPTKQWSGLEQREWKGEEHCDAAIRLLSCLAGEAWNIVRHGYFYYRIATSYGIADVPLILCSFVVCLADFDVAGCGCL